MTLIILFFTAFGFSADIPGEYISDDVRNSVFQSIKEHCHQYPYKYKLTDASIEDDSSGTVTFVNISSDGSGQPDSYAIYLNESREVIVPIQGKPVTTTIESSYVGFLSCPGHKGELGSPKITPLAKVSKSVCGQEIKNRFPDTKDLQAKLKDSYNDLPKNLILACSSMARFIELKSSHTKVQIANLGTSTHGRYYAENSSLYLNKTLRMETYFHEKFHSLQIPFAEYDQDFSVSNYLQSVAFEESEAKLVAEWIIPSQLRANGVPLPKGELELLISETMPTKTIAEIRAQIAGQLTGRIPPLKPRSKTAIDWLKNWSGPIARSYMSSGTSWYDGIKPLLKDTSIAKYAFGYYPKLPLSESKAYNLQLMNEKPVINTALLTVQTKLEIWGRKYRKIFFNFRNLYFKKSTPALEKIAGDLELVQAGLKVLNDELTVVSSRWDRFAKTRLELYKQKWGLDKNGLYTDLLSIEESLLSIK